MLALLTGSPGVGKTTVATALAARYPMQVETVSFGTLIHQAVNDRHRGELSYAEFRRLAAQLVRQADIEAATDLVIALKSSLGAKWLVVDSHAVAQTSYGWHTQISAAISRSGLWRLSQESRSW
jgi:adenylate kinase